MDRKDYEAAIDRANHFYGKYRKLEDEIEFLKSRLAAADRVIEAFKKLKSAAWRRQIEQIMYDPTTTVLRDVNEALAEYKKAKEGK